MVLNQSTPGFVRCRCPKCNRFLFEASEGSKIRIKCTKCDIIWIVGPIDRKNIVFNIADLKS